MKSFKTLELSEKFYHMSESTDLKGVLRDQLLRASSSIALNLAEGNAKRTVREKKRFYQIAYASVQECKMIFRLGRIKDEELIDTADKLGAWIYNLLKSDIKSSSIY
jgi:four helix bundle protein